MNNQNVFTNSLKKATLFCTILALGSGSAYAGKGGKNSGSASTGGDGSTTTTECPVTPTATGSVSGEAYSIDVDVSLLTESLNVDVGPFPHATLSASGGFDAEHIAKVDVLDLVKSHTLVDATLGGVGPSKAGSNSVSFVENLDILNGLVTADTLTSACYSYADGTHAASGAEGDILNLTIAGQSIDFDPTITKTIDLLNHLLGVLPVKVGEVVLNEKTSSGDGTNSSAITHNLIHVKLLGEPLGDLLSHLGLDGLLDSVIDGDIVITSTHCDINFDLDGGNTTLPPAEHGGFITGGGFIPGESGGKATFGVNARDGKGQIQYIDHSNGLKIHGKTVSSFSISGNCATFAGNTKEGQAYEVTACDNGEPGGGTDTFSISVNGYSNGDTLTHGNIQLH